MSARPRPGLELFPKFQDRLALATATVLGAGLTPKAPGTAGSLAALPLIYLTLSWGFPMQAAFWCALALIGVWAAARVCELTQSRDHSVIVIDELVGMGVATLGFTADWKTLAAAFLLFRCFDIAKLPPVRMVDRWSKAQPSFFWAGAGVLADDILAGAQTWLCLWLMTHEGWIG